MALFGAKWRFLGMVQEAVSVHSVAEVDCGEAFVSAFAARKAILLCAFGRLFNSPGIRPDFAIGPTRRE
jgi:hypothetical protein